MKSRPSRLAASLWILIAGGFLACSAVDERSSHDAAEAVVRIPFVLTAADNLAIRATLNGTDAVLLMFHTAVDSVSLTKTAIAGLSNFTANESVAVQSWGGTTEARQSTGNRLQIGDLTWSDLTITEGDNSGPGTDGKFGPHLFAGKVVEINFDARELSIHPTLPVMDGSFERLDLVSRHGSLFVMGEFTVADRHYTTEFMLHTGFGGTALLDAEFMRAHELGAGLATLGESTLKDSYGHEVKTSKVRLPALRLGTTTLVDVPVGIFEGNIGSQRTSIVGSGILKRFNLVIDADHHHLYMSRSQLFDATFAPAASAPAERGSRGSSADAREDPAAVPSGVRRGRASRT